jgi:hypothetical protein
VVDRKGNLREDARFSVFVGGFASRFGEEPPPPICDYREELDLLRIGPGEKVERQLGYIITKSGTPADFTVEITLSTDLADEQDAEAQRLIKLAGPERREFRSSATLKPEEKRTPTDGGKAPDNSKSDLPSPPVPPTPKQP